MQAIAPIITVRSDTFVIRTYGSANNASGAPIAKAYCEAVVSRIPQPVDPTATLAAPGIPFGRKFELISFRWLNQNEI